MIDLGKALDAKAAEQAGLPAGLKLTSVSSMPHAVKHSVDDFVEAVGEAVAIVLVVSLVSLGLRTGMVVVITIPIVLAVTALCMHALGIGLDKVSLGTLVLALGLLVDDAIIAVEMMAVKLEQGWSRARGGLRLYEHGIPDADGHARHGIRLPADRAREIEHRRIHAIDFRGIGDRADRIVVRGRRAGAAARLPHAARAGASRRSRTRRRGVRHGLLPPAVRVDLGLHRASLVVLGVTAVLFAIAMAAFTRVPQQFFPNSERPELLVDMRLPEGASFEATLREAKRLEKALDGRPEIDHVVDFVGTGAPRFYLPLDQQLQQPNFAQFVITAKDVETRDRLSHWLESTLASRFPTVRTRVARLENGRPSASRSFRVSGDDIAAVRGIAEKWRTRCAPTPARATCSSTGTSRPSGRSRSRSTSSRHASSA